MQNAQLHSLTGVRFFLALWVVVFHQSFAGGYLGEWMPTVAWPVFNLIRTGYVAVGVFFILSGFVLAYSYQLNQSWGLAELKRFGLARFARIYPAYLLGLILMAPYVIELSIPGYYVKLGLIHLTFLQSWFPSLAVTWNVPGWSLSDEIFFYLSFPWIGVLLWKISRVRSLLLAGFAVWLLALATPAAAVLSASPSFGTVDAALTQDVDGNLANLIRFNPLFQLPNFCAGILAARLYFVLRDQRWSGRGYRVYLPALLLEIVMFAFAHRLPYPLVHNGLLLPLHVSMIVGLALGGGILDRLLSARTWVFLGKASYSLYILHSPVARCLTSILLRTGWEPGAMSIMGIYVICSIAISSVTFLWIEEPSTRWIKHAVRG